MLQALDRAFGTFLPLLFAMWSCWQRTADAGGTAALVLHALAFLHFARARHGLYSDLVQVSLPPNFCLRVRQSLVNELTEPPA